jgi:BlaI family transcriptional regulator, penicillinase repressor
MPRSVHLSRRERQIMDVLYQLGEGSVADVVRELPDEPGYDAIRVTLGILHKRGVVQFRKDGARHIFSPTVARRHASSSALSHVLKTFFGGSPSKAVLALLDSSASKLTADDLEEIAAWVRQAKKDAR